jgi:hypothetical protein
MKLYSCDPETKVIGQNVLGFVENVQRDEIQPILKKHGLEKIDPDVWYPLQKWLDVLKELSIHNSMTNFVAIGMGISQTAPLPPGILDLPFEAFFLQALPTAYHMQHKDGDAGIIQAEKVSDTTIKMTVITPYPDDLEYGVTYGFARRIAPANMKFTVSYDSAIKRRDDGGEKTVILVNWE